VNVIRLVAWREFVERVRSPMFVVSNLFLALVFVGLGLAAAMLTAAPEPLAVGAVGQPAAEVATLIAGDDGTVSVVTDRRSGEEALRAGSLDLLVLDRTTVMVIGGPDPRVAERVRAAVEATGRTRALDALGIDATRSQAVLSPPEADFEVLETSSDAIDLRAGPVATATTIATLLFGVLAIFGQWVAQGIVEEKQSRVVEILLGTARPTHLLVGRIAGLGALGLFQVGMLLAIGTVAALVRGQGAMTASSAGAILVVLAWYVPGFVLYALLFSMSGSLVSRVEDLQSSIIIPTVLLIGSVIVVQVITFDPAAPFAQVARFLPLTAPILMPALMVAGLVGPFEVLASLAVTLLAIALLTSFAARIYRGGVLPGGGSGLRAAWSAGR
jgi:ABC-2 type transport system permease protein